MFDNNELTKEYILNKISEEKIFEKYFQKVEYGKGKFNIYYEDEKPTCYFYVSPDTGLIKFKDWSRKLNWDCFNIVQIKFNINFYQCLKKIASDFDIYNLESKIDYKEILKNRKLNSNIPCSIKFVPRKFSELDRIYWKDFLIDEELLKKFKVYPVKILYINDKEIYYHKGNDPCYAYMFQNNKIKIYFPKRKKENNRPRFFQNSSNILQGYEQLPEFSENIVITKSYKDVISMNYFDIVAVAPESETNILKPIVYNYLKSRCSNLYILFDNDRAGKRSVVQYRKIYKDIIPLMFEKQDEKDFTDNLSKYGEKHMIDYIEYVKNLLE